MVHNLPESVSRLQIHTFRRENDVTPLVEISAALPLLFIPLFIHDYKPDRNIFVYVSFPSKINLRSHNKRQTNSFQFQCARYLRDVVLCSLWRGKRHGRHGHHDGLVSGVDGRRGSLRARPYGGRVGGDGGPCRLHLSPLEKLKAKCERNKRQTSSTDPEPAGVLRHAGHDTEKKKKNVFTIRPTRFSQVHDFL